METNYWFSSGESGGGSGYQIGRSLRFNSADSAYLDRTPSSAGNRRTWTWSGWVKRVKLGAREGIFSSYTNNNARTYFEFGNIPDTLRFLDPSASNFALFTTAVFRDPSAWMHVVLKVDTTQATESDRVVIYVNGEDQDVTGTYPSQGDQLDLNQTNAHYIGSNYYSTGLSQLSNSYLADVHFIDGQALAPTDFGEFDDNGVWQPKEYTHNSPTTSSFTLADNDFTWSGLRTASATPDSGALTNGSLNYGDTFWGNSNANGSYLDIDMTGATDGETYSIRYWNAAEAAGQTITATCKQIDSNGNDISGTSSSQTWTQGQKWNTYIQTIASNCDRIRLIFSSNSSTSGWGIGEVEVDFIPSHTNDFYLDFSDNSTAAALGTDTSGNGNAWTVNNISVGAATSVSQAYSTTVLGSSGTANLTSLPNGNRDTFANIFDGSASNGYFTGSTINFDVRVNLVSPIVYTSRTVSIYHATLNSVEFITTAGNVTASTGGSSTGEFTYTNLLPAGASITAIRFFTNNNNTNDNVYFIKIDGQILNFFPSAAGNDSLVDSPTNGAQTDTGVGGEVVGNYCTWNPLAKGTDASLSNGNLDIAYGSASNRSTTSGTFGVSTGKWYWEITITDSSQGDTFAAMGIANTPLSLANYPGFDSNGWGYDGSQGRIYNGSGGASYGDTFGVGDVISVAFNADAGSLVFYKNGVSQGTAFTGIAAGTYFPSIGDGSQTNTFSAAANFGQRPFAYPAPSGFKALCTTNLPDSTIADGSTAFDTALYTGNGSTQSITGLNHSPDLVWIKCRSVARSNSLFDIVRGATKLIKSNETQQETTQPGGVTSFDLNGFSIGNRLGNNEINSTFVAWTWDAGSSTVTNNDGSIESQVRANPSAGFSIVNYAANGSAGTTGHGLNAVPGLIIAKSRSSAGTNWTVFHQDLGKDKVLIFTTSAVLSNTNYWGVSGVTSSTFGFSSNNSNSTGEMIAYCWAPVEGYSAFGSYTGNGSTDGPFVYTGFRPRWVMIKRTDTENGWYILDSARGEINALTDYLEANSSNAEATAANIADFLSNGIKVRGGSTYYGFNASGGTYIYAAFAENPFKTARAR